MSLLGDTEQEAALYKSSLQEEGPIVSSTQPDRSHVIELALKESSF